MPTLRPKAKPHAKEESEDESPLSSSEIEESDWETPRKKRKTNAVAASAKNEQKLEPMKEEPEEDIYALPIGTSDEEEFSDDMLSDGLERPRTRRTEGNGQMLTLEEKLRQKTDEEKGMERSPSSSHKRSANKMLGSSDMKEEIFDMWSQPSAKKRRSVTFGRRKTLDSSMTETHPPSSAPPPKSSVTSVEQDTESSDDEYKGKQRKEFKVPLDFDSDNLPSPSPPLDITDSENDSPLSSAPSYGSIDLSTENEDDSRSKFNPADYLCPMCKEPVDPGALLVFRAQPKQRIRDQRKFCESHKISSAEQEWKNAGYPTIDWDEFDQRIESHFSEIERLMVPDNSSYYRNYLKSMLKDGKAKNFALKFEGDALEALSCGYYGTRGSERMLQRITTRYARKLRRLAAEDHIVNQAGVVGYTQAVLVPELAIRLIKEDMGVDDASARNIMRESINLGEKMNPAPNDVVPAKENEGTGLLN
ncbi:RTC4 family protein [Aspergillus foveolatus]|uniref:RTC4 family protein n=1 Tax=Aspergillus foveolatus TaxID=210207 RepID=UPI003CCE4FF0